MTVRFDFDTTTRTPGQSGAPHIRYGDSLPRCVQFLAGIQLGQQLRRDMELLAQSFLRRFEAKPLQLRLFLDLGR
jgi:hypothetical protein